MKKILVLGLLLVYGATSFGVSLNLHYCCGQLQEITLSNTDDHECDAKQSIAVTSISKSCCIDQQLSISIHADQSQLRQEISFSQAHEVIATKPFRLEPAPALQEGDRYFHLCNSPPGSSIPLFIKHCVFRV